jgi:hypothetical protein
MTIAGEFLRKNPEDDTAKLESICAKCTRKLSAYTAETLTRKEVSHKCQDKRTVYHPPRVTLVPKQKLY